MNGCDMRRYRCGMVWIMYWFIQAGVLCTVSTQTPPRANPTRDTSGIPLIFATDKDAVVTLPCDFSAAVNNCPVIEWYKRTEGERSLIAHVDEQNGLESYREFTGRVVRGSLGALVIITPRVGDSGRYVCLVNTNEEKTKFLKVELRLNVTAGNGKLKYKVPDSFYRQTAITDTRIEAREMDAVVRIPCDVKLLGCTETKVFLYKQNRGPRIIAEFDGRNRITSGDQAVDRVARGKGCNLILIMPTVNDSGEYAFEVWGKTGSPKRQMGILLHVQQQQVHKQYTCSFDNDTEPSTFTTTTCPNQAEADIRVFLAVVCLGWSLTALSLVKLISWGNRMRTGCTARQTPKKVTCNRIFFAVGIGLAVLATALVLTSSVYTSLSFSSGTSLVTENSMEVVLASGIVGICLHVCVIVTYFALSRCLTYGTSSAKEDDENGKVYDTISYRGDVTSETSTAQVQIHPEGESQETQTEAVQGADSVVYTNTRGGSRDRLADVREAVLDVEETVPLTTPSDAPKTESPHKEQPAYVPDERDDAQDSIYH